jgi:hypothetical protein
MGHGRSRAGCRPSGDPVNEPTPRRKIVAFILSGIFPGLGQLYNRQPAKGAAFVVAGVVFSWLFLRAAPTDLSAVQAPPANLILLACLLLAVWLWSLVDAWRVADR